MADLRVRGDVGMSHGGVSFDDILKVFPNSLMRLQKFVPAIVVETCTQHPYLSAAVGLTGILCANSMVTYAIWRIRRRRRRQTYPRGVAILHQYHRGRFAPSFSPFPLKLETYLRMVNVPYETCFEEPIGNNGYCPWITYNGEDVYGAQTCLDYLNDRLCLNTDKGLSEEAKAVARAIRIMIEDHLYWCVALYQWHYDTSRQINNAVQANLLFRAFVRPMVASSVRQSAYRHGIGRNSQGQILEMGLDDLHAISQFLGNKMYLMGGEPTEVDSTAFAFLANIMFNLPFSPYAKTMNGECVNLRDYVRRMKERFWSDWDYCLAVPPTTGNDDFSSTRTVRQF